MLGDFSDSRGNSVRLTARGGHVCHSRIRVSVHLSIGLTGRGSVERGADCGVHSTPHPRHGTGAPAGSEWHRGLVSIVAVWAAEPCQLLGRGFGNNERRASIQRRQAPDRAESPCPGGVGSGLGLGSDRSSTVGAFSALLPSLPFPGRISFVLSLTAQAVFCAQDASSPPPPPPPRLACHRCPSVNPGNRDTEG